MRIGTVKEREALKVPSAKCCEIQKTRAEKKWPLDLSRLEGGHWWL